MKLWHVEVEHTPRPRDRKRRVWTYYVMAETEAHAIALATGAHTNGLPEEIKRIAEVRIIEDAGPVVSIGLRYR